MPTGYEDPVARVLELADMALAALPLVHQFASGLWRIDNEVFGPLRRLKDADYLGCMNTLKPRVQAYRASYFLRFMLPELRLRVDLGVRIIPAVYSQPLSAVKNIIDAEYDELAVALALALLADLSYL
jgi:hypothetical protein